MNANDARSALSRRAFLALALATPALRALGRKPYGGTVRLELPFSVGTFDVHASTDLASALFASAVADPLFAWDAQGRPYPALAAGLPEPGGGGAAVTLRAGLVTARGKALDARDVIASLERAKRGAARALLSGFRPPVAVVDQPLTVLFPGANADELAVALASPAVAITPRAAVPRLPDGTGAFRATLTRDALVLERNERAARGPAYLDRVEVRSAPDLATALRSFEAGDVDVGFLGAGLHRRRATSVDFRTGPLGFVVLRTGGLAKAWGAPGVASRLADSVDAARLEHLGLEKSGAGDGTPWGGAAGELVVDESAPYLLEVARVVAASLSQPGHELTATPLSRGELRARLQENRFLVAVDFVRGIGESPRHLLLALLSTLDPRLADQPPGPAVRAESVLRTLPVAVLGRFSLSGARAGDVFGLESWDLGAVFRKPAG